MKKYLIALVLVFSCSFYLHSQWVKQTNVKVDLGAPFGEVPVDISSETLYAIDFVDDKYGWTVGVNGTILHTKDGGQTWKMQMAPVSENLKNVDMVSRTEGWIVGNNYTVLHTTDGGIIWELDTVIDKGYYLEALCFSDEKHGWIGGMDKLMQTSDGGKTWVENSKVEAGGCLNCYVYGVTDITAIHFIDSLTGCVVGSPSYAQTMYTTDGGVTWKRGDYSITCSVFDVCLLSETKGVIAGMHNWSSSNSCVDWYHLLASGGHNVSMYGVDCVDENNIYLVGDSGVITRSVNGQPYYQVNSNTTSKLYDICIVDENNAWVVGRNGTILKNDWKLSADNSPKMTKALNISPNPMKISSKVKFVEPITGVLNMYNLFGERVKSLDVEDRRDIEISRGNLPSGVYILSVQQNGENSLLGKLIISD